MFLPISAPEAESISEEVHRGAIDAAVDLARVCTSPAAIRLVKTISAVVLYMLNAAVVISVAIRTGAYQHAQAELSDLLMKVVDTLANHGRMSLNTAIATNAQKAIDALFRLIRHLAQPCDGSAMQPGSLEFPIVLRRLAELSHSPDALSVLLDDPAWQQAGRLQLESTTSLQSLALLEGMDFFQWPDVMGESWNSSSTLSYSQ